jgi:CDP-glycerol glycerophosphotransferase (TagB/SpsB family)
MQKTMTFKSTANARIQMVEMGEESVQDLMHSSMLMITDYSSVSWEFLSLQKPVIFYRFDIESFLSARESYIDLRDETYGDIAYDEDQLTDLLRQYLEGTRSFRDEIRSSVGCVLPDGNVSNCEQIYCLVSQTLGSPTSL